MAGDPLRGLAALGVGIYHAGTVSLFASGHSGDLAVTGWTGPFGKIVGGPVGAAANCVGVFLVLSGYLISRPFLAAFADAERMPRLIAFLRNRVLRIVPGFWIALALVVLVAGAQGRTWADAPRLAGFSEDWATSPLRFDLGQAWTLGVEVRYYLAVPLIAGLVAVIAKVTGRPRSRAGRLWLVTALALAGAGACFAGFARSTQEQDFTLGAQGHLLLLGVVLAAAELGLRWRWLAGRAGRLLALGAFGLAVVALVWMQYPGSPWPSLLPFSWELSIDTVSALAALLIVGVPVLLQRAGAGCWRALDNAPLRWLGARSYGFYLYQLLVFTELSHHAPDPGLYRRTFVFLVVVGVPLTLFLAALSWRLVEQPALRRKVSMRPTPRPAPGPNARADRRAVPPARRTPAQDTMS